MRMMRILSAFHPLIRHPHSSAHPLRMSADEWHLRPADADADEPDGHTGLSYGPGNLLFQPVDSIRPNFAFKFAVLY